MSKIQSFFSNVKTLFTADNTTAYMPKCTGLFLFFLAAWAVMWTVLPVISLENQFIDVLENLVWGRHFQLGYDKNPPFGAWVTMFFHHIAFGGLWINYLVSQIFVAMGIFFIWRLARKMLPEREAILAAIGLFAINFYGMKSVELCDDVMELGLWPETVWFFYEALNGEEKRRFISWILCSLFAGLAMMTKYFAPALFLPMMILLIFTENGRAAFRKPGIYAGLVLFIAITLPNILWLFANDMTPVHYALGRASLGTAEAVSAMEHIQQPLRAFNRAIGVFGVPVALFAAVFFYRNPLIPALKRGFDATFLHWMCWGPFGMVLLFSIITGGSINYSWLLPCFSLVTIWLFYFRAPHMNHFKFKLFIGLIITLAVIFGVIFVVRSLEHQGYRKRGCDYENYPGEAVAAKVADEWRKLTGKPVPYVIADREASCNFAVYCPDAPEAYFSADGHKSQWIDENAIDSQGAVLIWDGEAENMPEFLKKWIQRGQSKFSAIYSGDFNRAVPAWYRALRGDPPVKRISWCFQLPVR